MRHRPRRLEGWRQHSSSTQQSEFGGRSRQFYGNTTQSGALQQMVSGLEGSSASSNMGSQARCFCTSPSRSNTVSGDTDTCPPLQSEGPFGGACRSSHQSEHGLGQDAWAIVPRTVVHGHVVILRNLISHLYPISAPECVLWTRCLQRARCAD